jgi:hypothetical protein
MRTTRLFGFVAATALLWCGILAAGQALMPVNGIFAAVVAFAMTYGLWMTGAAAVRSAGDRFQTVGLGMPKAYGFLVLVAGAAILTGAGADAPALAVSVLGTLALSLCVPRDQMPALRSSVQPLCMATGFAMFASSLKISPAHISGAVMTEITLVVCGAVLAVWLWSQITGLVPSGADSASLQMLNPVPVLFASLAFFGPAMSVSTVIGAVCLAMGAFVISHPHQHAIPAA